MGYPILEKMQAKMRAKGFTDSRTKRPMIPKADKSHGKDSYITNAIEFIRTDCEGLRFENVLRNVKDIDERNEILNLEDHGGKSFSKNQIPALMEKEIDRLCLERTLSMFLEQGTDSAAFLVYYCYLEMFWDTTKDGPRRMIALLSEFERNASPLLYSHRDHFVHSVYVFALGLAIYHQSAMLRKAYQKQFKFDTDQRAAHHFLRLWGFTALFHDLGYPFELAFQQVDDYFSNKDVSAFYKTDVPAFYVSYKRLVEKDRKYEPLYKSMFPNGVFDIDQEYNANTLFAAELTTQLYDAFHGCPHYKRFRNGREDLRDEYYRYILDILNRKVSDPTSFGNNDHLGFMDHAYFSAYLLLHQLWKPNERDKMPDKDYLKALTAILLHNSLLSKQILKGTEKKLKMDIHPLAFLLIFCDELQCWNRFGYGRKSRKDNHPIDCSVDIIGETISATYHFASWQETTGSDTLWKFSGSKPYKFITDIEEIVYIDVDDTICLNADYDFSPAPVFSGVPLSRGSLLDCYNLALILHCEYRHRIEYNKLHKPLKYSPDKMTQDQRNAEFNKLSLEYKLANLYQMMQFAYHLDKVHLFYTHRRVAFMEFKGFIGDERNEMGKMRHNTWANWRTLMGWQMGARYLSNGKKLNNVERNRLREQLREHEYLKTPFEKLKEKKEKDIAPIELLIDYMKDIYNLRVYRVFDKETATNIP